MYTLPIPVLLLMLIQMEVPGQEDDYTEYRERFFGGMSYVCIRAYASCILSSFVSVARTAARPAHGAPQKIPRCCEGPSFSSVIQTAHVLYQPSHHSQSLLTTPITQAT